MMFDTNRFLKICIHEEGEDIFLFSRFPDNIQGISASYLTELHGPYLFSPI